MTLTHDCIDFLSVNHFNVDSTSREVRISWTWKSILLLVFSFVSLEIKKGRESPSLSPHHYNRKLEIISEEKNAKGRTIRKEILKIFVITYQVTNKNENTNK